MSYQLILTVETEDQLEELEREIRYYIPDEIDFPFETIMREVMVDLHEANNAGEKERGKEYAKANDPDTLIVCSKGEWIEIRRGDTYPL